MEQAKAPGLKWMKRANGAAPIWVADEADVKKGFLPKTVNLSMFVDQPDILKAKCDALQADMLLWRAGYRNDPLAFDGTVKSLLTMYQCHDESPFKKLKPASRRTYVGFLSKIEAHIGARRVDAISGVDIIRYHKVWSNGGENLATAAMCRSILESALSFGVMNKHNECAGLLLMLREAKKNLSRASPRTQVITPSQVAAARAAANAANRRSSALAYAFAFETTLRLWDVIGQWYPMNEGGLSDVLDPANGEKWFGLRWEDIDEHMVLRFTPSKTEETTGRKIIYPLAKAPMVMEEIKLVPQELRIGPIVVCEDTGIPYRPKNFAYRWRLDRKAANIPSTVWARDLRASGLTEGRAANASIEDAAKVAGHTGPTTTARVYDRAVFEAADRFADARLRGREQSGNGSGNGR
ncbi:integrase [Mesorhizobium sp. M1B.F.Ca.ET.045.04.1.1]|uniref:integrase n=1 Tax=Mesorhizobium sp. M1B.F.Ca.ET.045.04.1.1 TaxID=2493673 RepID=UPI000F74D4A0|nr:integrase [Mesorhizobium sp. M1B.F.Ca.ET.045.04.1.1]AZO29291.1 integrase [Mesorhizobium sp. M1B.F.Ca.ET.045.04.1.1]